VSMMWRGGATCAARTESGWVLVSRECAGGAPEEVRRGGVLSEAHGASPRGACG